MKKKIKPRLSRRPSAPAKRRVAASPPDALLVAALRGLGEGVFIAEPKPRRGGLRILFANERLCAMTGYGAAELFNCGHAFLHADQGTITRQRRWLKKLAPGNTLSGEGYLVGKSGANVYAAWNFTPLFDTRGRLAHIVATYRDMTTKRRMQEALVHAQRLDAVGRLAGGVAHDFNNLLSVINGYCEILAARLPAADPARREIHEIHQAGQKAAVLVRQLLAFSRRQKLHPQVISLSSFVRDHGEILSRLLGNAGKLMLDLAHDTPNVRADPAQLQQILLNVTLNARDALRTDGRVTISTAAREIRPVMHRRLTDLPPGRYAMLSVSDNGIGMDAATQAQIFEPFFTTKGEGKGTGLGLSIVYGIVQQSGGHIQVHSAPGAGTTFEIFLPEVRERAQPIAAASPPLPATHGRETVLLIEEDDLVRKMVEGILTADGYKVLPAAHAADASREARRHGPVHLLIAPFSGDAREYEKLARTLHQTMPTLRVVGTGKPSPRPLGWLPPIQQISILKPFELSTLLRAIRGLLDAKS